MAKRVTKPAPPASPSSSLLDHVRAAVAPVVIAGPQLDVAPIAEFRALDAATLAARVKSANGKTASAQINLGKMLVVMNEQRGDKGTLASYVRKQVGEIDSSAYKAANAFGMVGIGHGSIEEKEFDACPLRWLIVVSAILNVLAKSGDDILNAGTREEVAKVLRARPANGYATLRDIKKCLMPEKQPGDGETETDGAEVEEQKAPADYLTREHIKAVRAQLDECKDPATLELMAQGFGALAAIAQGELEELSVAAA